MTINDGFWTKLENWLGKLLLSSKIESKITQLGQHYFKFSESICIILVGRVVRAGFSEPYLFLN
jgi:hypothetical protein